MIDLLLLLSRTIPQFFAAMADLISQSRFQTNQKQLKRLRYSVRRIFRSSRTYRGATEAPAALQIIPKDAHAAPFVEVMEVPGTPPPSYPSTPQCQRALIIARKGEYEIVDDFPHHGFENEDEVLIRGVVVGLNPIDWKSVSFNFCLPSFPWVCLGQRKVLISSC